MDSDKVPENLGEVVSEEYILMDFTELASSDIFGKMKSNHFSLLQKPISYTNFDNTHPNTHLNKGDISHRNQLSSSSTFINSGMNTDIEVTYDTIPSTNPANHYDKNEENKSTLEKKITLKIKDIEGPNPHVILQNGINFQGSKHSPYGNLLIFDQTKLLKDFKEISIVNSENSDLTNKYFTSQNSPIFYGLAKQNYHFEIQY